MRESVKEELRAELLTASTVNQSVQQDQEVEEARKRRKRRSIYLMLLSINRRLSLI
jgi:hypothetical protein